MRGRRLALSPPAAHDPSIASDKAQTLSGLALACANVRIISPATIQKYNAVVLLVTMQWEWQTITMGTAFLAILFAFIGLSDLTALSLSDEVFDQFWGTQTPVRLAFLFAVTGYSYASKEGGMFAPRTPDYAMGAGASVSNSIVFTWGFFELVTWFFVSILACDGGRGLANAKTQVYTSLRQEKQEKMNQIAEKRKAEEKDQL